MRNWITNLSDLLLRNEKQELSWNEKKKSTIQRRSLSTSDKRTKTMKLLGAKSHTKKELKVWKHFRNSSREATEIQLLTNLAFKIAEFLPELPILCFTARSLKNLAIQICCCCRCRKKYNNSTFLKNRFHSQLLCLLTLIFGFFCRLLLCLHIRHWLCKATFFFLHLARASNKVQKSFAALFPSWNLNHGLIALNDNRVMVNWFEYYNINKFIHRRKTPSKKANN